tara:strand:+ start:59 stop:181 length:123 start_codon:yes stop_codon:yes gene_type:complete
MDQLTFLLHLNLSMASNTNHNNPKFAVTNFEIRRKDNKSR